MSAGISEGEVVDALFELRPCLGPEVTDRVVQALADGHAGPRMVDWLIDHAARHQRGDWREGADCLADVPGAPLP